MPLKFAAVILAAGQGKRMNSDLPKVLHPIKGRPLISWVIDAAKAAGADKIVAIIGHGKEKVIEILPPGVEWAVQDQQLGTGHAARCAEAKLKDYAGPIAVLCGDVPLLKSATIADLVKRQADQHADLVVLTAMAKSEHAYGRIVRDAAGNVLRIVENKDATAEEKKIQEINTGTYAFGPGKLFPALAQLSNKNSQGEYYLTDTLGWYVNKGGKSVAVVAPKIEECLGVNTPEDLKAAAALV